MEVEDFKIQIKAVPNMQDSEVYLLIEKFNLFGFVLIEHEPGASRENLLALSKYFGNIIYHDRSETDGIVPIQAIDNYPQYVNTTAEKLSLHTDGSFEKYPPKVVAMQCEVAAVSGGFTTLVNARDIYEYLGRKHPELLLSLFAPDVLTVERNTVKATQPIFQYQGRRIYMIFRSDNSAKICVKPESLKGFQLIKEILENPQTPFRFKIQPNQILVFDNTKMLHGRTAFLKEDYRKLNRLWFDGQPDDFYPLQFGFSLET